MKIVIFLFCLIFFSNPIIAQDSARISNDFKKNQIGIGIISVPALFFSKLNQIDFNYNITYKRRTQKVNIRSGIAFNYSPKDSNRLEKKASGVINYYYKKSIGVNLGVERIQKIFNRFHLFYGADFFLFNRSWARHIKFYTKQDEYYSEIEYGLGIGPIIGLEYYFNSKFSIMSEINMDYTFMDNFYSWDNYYKNQKFNKETVKQWRFHRFASLSFNYLF